MAPTAEIGLDVVDALKPDLILLDLNLPGMDGFQALEHLREKESARHLPIIAVSAHAMDAQIKRARAAGFDDYITKPFSVDEVLTKVASVLQVNYTPPQDSAPGNGELSPADYPGLDWQDAGKIAAAAATLPPAYLDVVNKQAADLPGLIDKVQAAREKGDAREMERAAHSLKSYSASFGVRTLSTLAQAVEARAKAGDLTAVTNAQVEEMHLAYANARKDIGRLLEDLMARQAGN